MLCKIPSILLSLDVRIPRIGTPLRLADVSDKNPFEIGDLIKIGSILSGKRRIGLDPVHCDRQCGRNQTFGMVGGTEIHTIPILGRKKVVYRRELEFLGEHRGQLHELS